MQASTVVGGELLRLTEAIAPRVWPFVATVFVVAFLAMALLQVVKDLTPLRYEFQRRWFLRWLEQKSATALTNRAGNPELVTPELKTELWHGSPGGANAFPARLAEVATTEIVSLATGGDERAFFGLEIERLCGQLNSAATMVFDFPSRHQAALLSLGAEAKAEDIDTLISGAFPADGQKMSPVPQEVVNARNRVAHHVQRSIDAFQISAADRWKVRMQAAAIVVSVGIAVAAVALSGEGVTPVRLVAALPVGVGGGMVAPLLRDLLSAFTRLGKA